MINPDWFIIELEKEQRNKCDICRYYPKIMCQYCKAYMDGVEQALEAVQEIEGHNSECC